MFWIVGEKHQGNVHGPWRKGKTNLRLGKGWSREKNKEDIKPQKFMRGSIKPSRVTILGVVTHHVLFKPEKEK
jgi:hypothetical protein